MTRFFAGNRHRVLYITGHRRLQIEGQDSLEVRTVALANGQVASLILEEGRLQRIVSSNGQIAELSWQPPPEPRGPQGGRRSRQLSVKMHRGVSP